MYEPLQIRKQAESSAASSVRQAKPKPLIVQAKSDSIGEVQPTKRMQFNLLAGVQAKLTIGQPNDQYEQEADRVAAQVVNQIHTTTPPQQAVQREALDDEEIQMKPEIQCRADQGSDASSELEAAIQQARGGGEPLERSIREPMEQAFGADFSGVKVHTDAQADQLNQAIQAKAFTTQQDLFFKQGEYNPGSRSGQELIAHELTHVVQQRGRENSTKVQRLMTPVTFQETSPAPNDDSLFSKGRNKVKQIDGALAKYHSLSYVESAKEKFVQLQQVINECERYLEYPDDKAKRKLGVKDLLAEASIELPVAEKAVPIFSLADSIDKVRQAIQFQDSLMNKVLEEPSLQELNIDLASIISRVSMQLSAEDKKNLMDDDLKALAEMSRSEDLPEITRSILKEVLENVGLIDFTLGPAGAGFTGKGDDQPKYFVMNSLKRNLGAGERLGGLAHELTHVAMSESYGNTKMMWSFVVGLPEDDIKALSEKREEQLTSLLNKVDAVPELQDSQKNRIKEQLEYAKRPNLMADEKSLTKDELTTFNALKTKVNWSTLVEFDTNINQCLVYMASWGVSAADPFYRQLRAVATEAALSRRAAKTVRSRASSSGARSRAMTE